MRQLRICRRCLREFMPSRAQPAVSAEAHRGEETFGHKLSPEGQKIKDRKERKGERRYLTHAVVKLVLSGAIALPAVPSSEECPRCLALNAPRPAA